MAKFSNSRVLQGEKRSNFWVVIFKWSQVTGILPTCLQRNGVDVEHGFKPKYEVSSDKKALVSKLKALAKKS
jgi:DNA topoisomerase IA